MGRELYHKLEKIRSPSVAVIGDVILDHYIGGEISRISPEAPVGVVDATSEEYKLGGAANVASNLAHLGCKVHLFGVAGQDANANILNALLKSGGIPSGGIVRTNDRPTISKTRVMAQHQQILRIDRERRVPLDEKTAAKVLSGIKKIISRVDGIILSDYDKGLLTKGLLKSIISLARKAGKPVIVDPKGSSFEKYRHASIMTPNRAELERATGIRCRDEKSVAKAARRLLETCALNAVLATLGADGMALFEKNSAGKFFPTEAKEVFDVTGAGDTVVAVFTASWLGGLPAAAAARLSNHAGGLQVAHLGAVAVSREEIEQSLAGAAGMTERKIVDLKTGAKLTANLKKKKKKVVFTNGCFDILHYGHIQYLQKAKNLGDFLVVGLNSDASVRRLKGPKRPLINEHDRAHILAALDSVDQVILFADPTPIKLINAIKPDVLAKGGDYKPAQVVGNKEVKAWGGRVEILPYISGNSTTGIIQKIARNQK